MTPAVKAFVVAAIRRLRRRDISELEAKIAKLMAQNSSLPPSLQHPHAKPQHIKLTSNKRMPGGHPGASRHVSTLIPSQQCDEVITEFPSSFRPHCKEFSEADSNWIRHQVTKLPVTKPSTAGYQLNRLNCSFCDIRTSATLPQGVRSGQGGPRLVAFTRLLMGHFRQSKRRVSLFLEELLKAHCGLVWTVKTQNLVADSLAAPYKQLRDKLPNSRRVSWTSRQPKRKLPWHGRGGAVAAQFSVFGVFLTRNRESLQRLVGGYSGVILNCDRTNIYIDGTRLQWCRNPLKRDMQKLIDSSGHQGRRLGHDLIRQ